MTATRLVAGLGNPGAEYEQTRHNLGFRVIEVLRGRLRAAAPRSECGAVVCATGSTLLAMPQIYMNRSGWAIRCLVNRHQVGEGDLLVVYDDIDLPLGRMRARAAGGPGGHRGMESIVESLRTDQVARLRLGIAPYEPVAGDLSDFVLAPFAADERAMADDLVAEAADAVALWLRDGIVAVMNRHNA